MPKGRRALLSLMLAGVASVGVSACGDGDTDTVSPGGSVTVASTAFPEALGPAIAYTQLPLQALWNAYTPLLTYPHLEGKEGTDLIPGLAQSLPEVSADGKTYSLKLRQGLKYSDGSAVKASDFEHSVQRLLNLESLGTPFFSGIVGAEKYIGDGNPRADISGIETDDATGAITIKLAAPDGTFANVLALSYAGLVPGDTPFRNLTKSPPPGVGPYRVTNVRSNRGYDLVKVPGFDVEGLPKGNLDKITIAVSKSRSRQTADTIANKIDVMSDPPTQDKVREVRERFGGERYAEYDQPTTYYFFLNERLAPFNKKAVREAVNRAVDRPAIARLYAGLLNPSCNFLPPGLKGYEKIDPCPFQPPNLDAARTLVKEAGAEGADVTVYGNDEPETKAVTEYIADVMDQIGLDAKPRILEASAYFPSVSSQKTKAQAGFNAYGQDFPHPASLTFLVDGKSIQKTSTSNFGNIDDKQINTAIERAGRSRDLDAVADDYAGIDRRLVDEAHIVPFGNRKLTTFTSERVDFDNCIVWHQVYTLDYAKLCLKK